MGWTLWKIIKNATIWSPRLETIFLSKWSLIVISRSFLPRNRYWKKIPFFDDNHGLTPLENTQKCDYLKGKFLRARNDSFLSKRSPNIISRWFLPKRRKCKKCYCLTNANSWVNPLGKYSEMRLSEVHIL